MGLGKWGLATGVLTNPLKGWDSTGSKPLIETNSQITGLSTPTEKLADEKRSVKTFVEGTVNDDMAKVKQNPSDIHAEAQLAADLASLHRIEQQLFTDAGNLKEAEKFAKDPSFTEEGETNDLLKKAGAKDDKSSDYAYAASQDSSGYTTQTATIKGQSASDWIGTDLATHHKD